MVFFIALYSITEGIHYMCLWEKSSAFQQHFCSSLKILCFICDFNNLHIQFEKYHWICEAKYSFNVNFNQNEDTPYDYLKYIYN